MKELGITKGEWQYRDHFSDGIIETEETIIGHLMKWGSPEDELQSNAILIIDAGNTAQKCGLLPSELLRQRDELREAFNQMRQYWSLIDSEADAEQIAGSLWEVLAIAEAAIKNTDG